MKSLEPTPAVLLDYLYGLLDEADQRHVEAALQASPEWRSALEQARGHRDLLAQAARHSFPEVAFDPPAPRTQQRQPQATLSFPAARVRRPWLRLAVAASVLFVLGFGGWALALVGSHQHQMHLASQDLARLQQQERDFGAKYKGEEQSEQDEIRALQEKIKKLEAQWKGDRQKVLDEVNKQQFQVIITGPKTVQAGAANQYRIETRQKKLQAGGVVGLPLVPSRIKAKVIDPALPRAEQVLYEEEAEKETGLLELKLPPSLPIQPGRQLELQVVAEGKAGLQAAVTEKLPLVGALYLTHLTTDRPLYRPGQTVHFRSLTLERFGLKPPQQVFDLVFTIIQPNGMRQEFLRGTTNLKDAGSVLLRGPDGNPVSGIGAGDYVLPADAPGGEWTLEVHEAGNRFPTQTRKFLVNNYQAPRLNKDVEFTRKSYGPGDEVNVRLKVHRVDGNAPVQGQKVEATVHVDNVSNIKVEPEAPVTDNKGEVELRFVLPGKDKMTDGQGAVALKCFDGEHHETVVRPIPIVLNRLDVSFYPEGGDLVAGVKNRVYFEVKAKNGKPAELQGWLVDGNGKKVEFNGQPVAVRTFHDDREVGANQGVGRFEFIPTVGQTYQVKIETPIGIEGKYRLPEVRKDGVVLTVAPGVVTDKIQVEVTSGARDRKLLVGAYCRGQMLAQTTVEAPAGTATPLTLLPADKVSGVYRITVFEYRDAPNQMHLVPVAERLIFRRPVEKLNFAIKADKATYSPGERVNVSIKATDETGQAKPAVVLVKVVNQSVVKLADDKSLHGMPAYFYLTTEIKSPEELEYADFLVSDHQQAETALDMVLGTQGWRRFVEQSAPPLPFQGFGQGFVEPAPPQKTPPPPPAAPMEAQAPAGVAVAQPVQVPAQGPFVPVQNHNNDVERLKLLNGQAASQQQSVNLVEQAPLQVDRKYVTPWLTEQQELASTEKKNAKTVSERDARLATVQGEIQTIRSEKATSQGQYEERLRFVALAALITFAVLLLVVGFAALIVAQIKSTAGEPGASAYLRTGIACLGLLLAFGCFAVLSNLANRADLMDRVLMSKAKAPAAAQNEAAQNKALADKDADGRFKEDRGQAAPPAFPGLHPDAKFGGVPLPGKAPFPGGKGGNGMHDFAPGANVMAKVGAADNAFVMANPNIQQHQQLQEQMANGAAKDMPAGGDAKKKALRPIRPQDKFLGGPFKGKPEPPFGFNLGSEKELRQKGNFQLLARARLSGNLNLIPEPELMQVLPPDPQPFVVREYAHQHKKSGDGVRRDFAETLFWQPALVLPTGSGTVSFDLSDSVTTFEMTVWGHTTDGRLGAGTAEITSRLPFNIEMKKVAEISNTDRVVIPVTLTNDTAATLPVNLKAEAGNLKVVGDAEHTLQVGGNSKMRRLFTFQATKPLAEARLLFLGSAGAFGNDNVEDTIKIVPEGFPFVRAKSETLEGGQAVHTVRLPEQWVKGSVQLRVQAFPSTLADLQKGLEGLLREPHGCFEQTSSSNYPNVMILSYLKESEQAAPAVEQRARKLLADGYGKLVSFECQRPDVPADKRGYEWFGGTAPPHDGLTAYGLLQFGDMKKAGYPVDAAMLERTEKYLLGLRDGSGGFKHSSKALDQFGRAPAHIADAYIVWALTEYGTTADLSKELKALEDKAQTQNDSYFRSLVALSLHNAGKEDEAAALLKKLRTAQKDDGHVGGAATSITCSGGRELDIETTGLAVLGWLRANRPADFLPNVQKAVKWLGTQRGGFGGYGSTQSTVLTLKALIAHARDNKKTAEPGELRLYVNDGQTPVDVLKFPAGCTEELIVNLTSEDLLKPGDNKIRVELTGEKNAFPYTLTLAYNTLKPDNAPNCPVQLSTKLSRTSAKEGETVQLNATVKNTSGKGQGMTVAVIGLPAGLSVPEDLKQLKDLARLQDGGKTPGKIAHFEIRGRELVLYWRDLAPDQKIDVTLDLICRLPGEYRGPASRAYLYYQSDLKHWAQPLGMSIEP